LNCNEQNEKCEILLTLYGIASEVYFWLISTVERFMVQHNWWSKFNFLINKMVFFKACTTA